MVYNIAETSGLPSITDRGGSRVWHGVAMATPNGGLATPVATPFCLLDLIFFHFNFEIMIQSHYTRASPQICGGPPKYHPITNKLASLLITNVLQPRMADVIGHTPAHQALRLPVDVRPHHPGSNHT